MGRTARDRRERYRPKPVEHIELREGHRRRRLILAAVLLVFGGAMLGYGVLQLVRPDSDWITVEAESSAGITCGDDFVLLYRLGGGERSPTAERRGVTTLYTHLCREAYRQFSNWESFEDVGNLYDLNRSPNETVEVGGGLYAALSAVEHSGSRALYLGPVYDRYEGLFRCQDDSQLVDFDPRLSEDVAREYRRYAAFAGDPQAVHLELMEGNRVRLVVSQEYLDFARREGVESFIEFGWMRNAFIADFIAGELTAQGYTSGALSSYDGFCRNLGGGEADYSLTLYSRQGDEVYPAAELTYRGPMSLVSLRDYPVNDRDTQRFYVLRSGERRTPYLDPADGLCRNALPELTCCSAGKGCGEVLLTMLPIYVADEFRPDAPEELAQAQIECFWWQGRSLFATDPQAQLDNFYHEDSIQFSPGQ